MLIGIGATINQLNGAGSSAGPAAPVLVSAIAAENGTQTITLSFSQPITGTSTLGVTWVGLTTPATAPNPSGSFTIVYTVDAGETIYNDSVVNWSYVESTGNLAGPSLDLGDVSNFSVNVSALAAPPVVPVPDLYIPLLTDLVADTGTATTTVTRALNTRTDETAAGLISTINANLPRFYRGLGVLSEATVTGIAINDGQLPVLAGGTLTANDTTAPDGSANGDLFTADSGTGFHYLGRINITNVISGNTYCFTGKFLPGTETIFQLTPGSVGLSNSGNTPFANFICTGSGSVGSVGTGVTDSGCDLRPDGWYNCWFTAVSDVTGLSSCFVCFTGNNSSAARFPNYTAAGETGHFWDVGTVGIVPYNTTHTPVPSASVVTGNADVIQVDESLPTPTAVNDVSFGVDYTPLHDSGETDWLWSSTADASNGVYLLYDGTNVICRKRLSGGNNDATFALNVVAGTTYRVLGTLDSVNGVSISVEGIAGVDHVNTTDAVIGTTCELGADGSGGGQTSIVISEYVRYD